ncbi:hypothetical protein NE237_004422 [Protea cynaroides]|uniref:Symplekin n=1 Tax=Protea cynaroides TaxID=273540 RepID=A0A9Q0QTI2_9MAGN|nr:hypothetical protein NE237_004422 [Protea cynaroides]
MVGRMGVSSREKAASLLHSAKFAMDKPSKLQHLQQLNDLLLQRDPSLLTEFLPHLLEFQNDRFSPVRKFLAEMIGQLGMEHIEFLPEMVPVLIAFLKDDAPAVARQAITSGIDLFCRTFEKVAIQGLCSSELDSSFESSWDSMLKFKDMVYPIAFQTGNDGIRLLAVKFVEAMILLYTPDPDGPLEPPSRQAYEGKTVGFNMSWLRGGHPVLKIGDLSIEASQSLGLLLGQLRFPSVNSVSNAIVIVLINSLSAIAKQRPAFYGRILPVLLGLDLSNSAMKGVRVCGAHHALKNAFVSCLECTHPGAAPWRDRLVGALNELKTGGVAGQPVCQVGKFNGSVEDVAGEAHPIKEGKPSMESLDEVHIETGRKRSVENLEISDLEQDDGISTKRVRPTPIVSQRSTKESNVVADNLPLPGSTACTGDGDPGPVQQLLAMFGALVAQGEKAVGSLDILISSISADLLAEVVMANMCHLPATRPKAEGDDEPMLNAGYISSTVGSNTLGIQPPSFMSNVLSLSSAFPQIASLLSAQPSALHDADKFQQDKEHQAVAVTDTTVVSSSINDLNVAVKPSEVAVPSNVIVSSKMEDSSAIPLEAHDMGSYESGIPGLDSAVYNDGMVDTVDTSRLSSADIQGTNQDEVTSLDRSSPLDLPPTDSDRLEELNSNSTTHTATSVYLSSQYVLPKMSAPVVDLNDEQKDHLQKSAFLRIIEAYKQVKVAGGTNVCFSLLACLGMEYPLELDPWKLLQKHILSDYLNHEGHELTLLVLYRLFGEAEQDHDFFSSTTATSVYETFLLTVAETLRDSFPASDKSLTRLLGEVPYLPKTALKLLECLCCPGSSEKVDKELQSGDRVTQGLSAVWSLILLRPPIRDICLKIALQSAVHHLEEVQMKAIRLVANKLYPISCIAQQIEKFANDMLLSVMNGPNDMEGTDAEGSIIEGPKDSDLVKPANELAMSNATKEIASDSACLSSISEAQRCMSLYFALCTKKHSLFRRIFVIYKSLPKAVKQAVHRHIPILVRTMGSSSELLGIISDPPNGCENLLMQVLHTLTDGILPSPVLISTVRQLYESKLKDVEILIPILSSLPKDEVLSIFPQLINLPPDKFQAALARILQGSSHFGPSLTPAEVLIAIHGIDPERDGIALKKVTDACNACFEQRQVFTQQVLAKVLNQLVEQIPLPLLFMRTVLQAIGAFPALVDFIMEILSRLVSKQIWKYPKLWVGFLKCSALTKPQSFNVLLQLPAAQLENALNRNPTLKAPLVAHANQPNIRTSLPRSILVVLGIAPDSQGSSHTQMVQPQIADTSNSGAEAATEKSKES